MEDSSILERIDQLVAEEHALRQRSADLGDDDRRRLKTIEGHLDQCWDLLRQRRAREEYGENPDDAQPRSVSEVDSYLQ